MISQLLGTAQSASILNQVTTEDEEKRITMSPNIVVIG